MRFAIYVKYKGAHSFKNPAIEVAASNEADALRQFRDDHPHYRSLPMDHFKIVRLREPERTR